MRGAAESGRQSRKILVQGFFLARSRKAYVTAGEHGPGCGEISTEGRQSVTLELRSIPLELHTELAAQSPRKILQPCASISASKLTTTGPQKPVLPPRFGVEFTANSIPARLCQPIIY